jgi:hypothetical protein
VFFLQLGVCHCSHCAIYMWYCFHMSGRTLMLRHFCNAGCDSGLNADLLDTQLTGLIFSTMASTTVPCRLMAEPDGALDAKHMTPQN